MAKNADSHDKGEQGMMADQRDNTAGIVRLWPPLLLLPVPHHRIHLYYVVWSFIYLVSFPVDAS